MTDSLERLRAALAGRYSVERELGRGGMATVFLGEDLKHRRAVAIKVLDSELGAALGPERFVREIETAARLHHPHILPVLDSGVEGGLFYYVMPFVAGESLRARLAAHGQLAQDEAVRLAIEVARALDYAHRSGVVHRDIKPENILLADAQAVIADFGIARAIRESGGEHLTRTGIALGSPSYMSPEQTTGAREVDGRSDLYSLGCVLYEMIAGQPPFGGPAGTLAYQHLNLAPRPVRELRPTVSAELDAVIARALAKSPADRFASGAELVTALTNALRVTSPGGGAATTASVATPAPPAAVLPPDRTPRRIPVAVLTAVVLTLLFIGGIALWRTGAFMHKTNAGGARRWVWLAEFVGPPDDPSVAPAARDLVAGALDHSNVLASVPTEQVRLALRNSGRPDSTHVTPEVARELAFRSSIPVVVEGRIARLGASYTILLNATRSENGQVIATANQGPAGERDLVNALTRAARDLRRQLGERDEVFRTTTVWSDAPTPSFEAFKLYQRGRTLINAGDPWTGLTLLRQAVARDTAFAVAYIAMSTAYNNIARQDSVRWAIGEALRHAQQLTPARRLDAQARLASANGDWSAETQAYDAQLALDLSPVDRAVALNNKAGALNEMGRAGEAFELIKASSRLWPIGPTEVTRGNIADQLIGFNRLDEARDSLANLRGPTWVIYRVEIELAARHWERAESMGVALETDESAQPLPRRIGAIAHAAVRGARGDLRTAQSLLAAIARGAAAQHDTMGVGIVAFQTDWLARLEDRSLPPAAPLGRSTWGIAQRAERAALAGDSAIARHELDQWPPFGDPSSRRALEQHVAGCLAMRRGRFQEAVDALRSLALGGARGQPTVQRTLRPGARWIVADAFERLGMRDSALVYLRLVLDPVANEPPTLASRSHFEPWARSRIVRLLTELGRTDDARREWDVLVATCPNPDPPLAGVLEDTRNRLLASSAMGAGARR